MKLSVALIALLAPVAALAAGPEHVALSTHVMVEHLKKGPDGKPVMVREEPKHVVPGDTLIFDLSYRNTGVQPATGFTITDSLPKDVAFAGGESEGATFSVDGGRTWGPLAALRIAQPNGGSRTATLADVTHVRWALARPIPAGSTGSVSFRGTVK